MESNRIEYKRELTDGFEQEAVAFLNYQDSRVIYFGIDQDGSVVGLSNGDAVQLAIKVTLPSLIAELEALLIEALEPPQNCKRGDDFSVIEYIQDIYPELKERELQNTLRAIEQKLRGQA
jgi:hypothetical protein